MERYFLGNNTAYGFLGNYETELKNKRRVILLKGGPGTGKSSILKKLAAEAKSAGYDYELWYCSGDPDSLDGVYIKEIDTAIVDATAPHASGADSPKIKDFLYDLADSLSHDKLMKHKGEIDELLTRKKNHFMRAYQHLGVALKHFQNQLELEMQGLRCADIRAYAAVLASELRGGKRDNGVKRKVFVSAICPSGENVYYDHLRNKTIYKVSGSAAARKLFFDELCGLIDGGMLILNPLEPSIVDGIVYGGRAIVSDVGHFTGDIAENINLQVYEGAHADSKAIDEERGNVTLYTAFATEQLEKARECHLGAEKFFIGAMNFDNNGKIYTRILHDVFGK